jgi:RNA polymerase Rpb2, domain 7/RNA polymerase Rpb2, domain 6
MQQKLKLVNLGLFDGRTGNCFDQAITTGYSYMIKLVHLVDEKIHCLTIDHEVLTTKGWIPLNKVKTSHLVATLTKNGQLVYQNPTNIYHYPDFKGELYHIKNANLDLLVTLNHKMYVKNGIIEGKSMVGYQLTPAKDIVGQHKKYCKTAFWNKENFQFMLPSIISPSIIIPEKSMNMDAWLQFFGIWIAEGCALTNNISNSNVENFNQSQFSRYVVQISIHKKKVLEILNNIIPILGYSSNYSDNNITICDKQLWACLRPLSLGNSYRRLPIWVWDLSQDQARVLLLAMTTVFKNGENLEWEKEKSLKRESLSSSFSSFFPSLAVSFPELLKKRIDKGLSYYTSSVELADDITRLALHAGWSGNNYLLKRKGSISSLDGKEISSQFDIWRISIIQSKNQPAVNHGYRSKAKEEVLPYQGEVYCLSVPNEIFYVRRNGLPVWTGNSRSSGPYSLITQQPLKGRSKHGGQRLGEMEVWAIEAYGAAFTLLELLTIKSDDVTGRLTIWDYVLYKKPLYIGTPASFKVLICELQALCLDIGIYKADKSNILKQINVSSMG